MYIGSIGWEKDPLKFNSAIIRESGNEITLEFDSEGFRYTAILRQGNIGYYTGTFQRKAGNKISDGRINARLFSSPDGYFLFGSWHENNLNYKWWAELNEDTE
jgi:hypothetical protein